jgi:hypothetical protein
MKTLWKSLSFLAVVHLLALVMFITWLWQSGRLTPERIQDLKARLALTAREEKLAIQKQQAETDARAQAEIDQQLHENPPVSSGAQLVRAMTTQQQEAQTQRRLDDERKMLNMQLDAAAADVEQKEADFQRQQKAWLDSTAAQRDERSLEQFTKTVRQYEQTTPKQGKRMLVELIHSGRREQAVAYMNAMNARALSKIMKEFKTDEEVKLATGLLEDMATFGLGAEVSTDSNDAQGLPNPAQPAQDAEIPAAAP